MVVTRPQRVVLEIGELVLHGFHPADRHRIADALASELQRLFSQQFPTAGAPVPPDGQARAARVVDGGTFSMGRHSAPERTGSAVARAVHGALTAPREAGGRREAGQ